MNKLSVLIPSFNSEKYIRAALKSVKWADEIFVCDSFSTDKTLAIAKEYGARIVQHEYVNSAAQTNWAIPQCRHEWVLIVDTDEILEPGLKEEILQILETNDQKVNGYKIPRKNFIYGKWMRYGGIYPDYQLRLFRREKGRFNPRSVHAQAEVKNGVGILKHHLLHEGFKDLRTWMPKLDRYTDYEAAELRKKREKFNPVKIILFPLLVFLRTYFIKLGFLEGYRGFLLAVLNGIYYFLMYAKFLEKERLKQNPA